MPADKTGNYYLTKPDYYNNLLGNNIASKYKKITEAEVHSINSEAKNVAERLDLAERIEKKVEKDAFITLKDHKQNFQNQPKCRLIYPSKSEIGIISCDILQRINEEIGSATGLKQWRRTPDAIDWFNNIEDKTNMEFLQCGIVDFYPSISQTLLTEALKFAKLHTVIPKEEIEIIRHARKTVLFSEGTPWAKKTLSLMSAWGHSMELK